MAPKTNSSSGSASTPATESLPVYGSTPTQSPGSDKRSHFTIVIVAVLIVLAVVIAVLLRQSGMRSGGTDAGTINSQLTDEQKMQLLESLRAGAADVEPLTEEQRTELLNTLKQSNTETKPLTEAEQQRLLESLQR